jgi:hypothetical protein
MLGLLLVLALSASAQSRGTEVAVKISTLGFSSSNGTNLTSAGLGNGGGVGLGLFLSPGMAIEPSVNFTYLHSGGESSTSTELGLSLPVYLEKTWGHSGMYFAPGVKFRSISFSGESAQSQFALEGEVGSKVKIADPVSLRLGVMATNWFKTSDNAAEFGMTGFLGVSIFLKK